LGSKVKDNLFMLIPAILSNRSPMVLSLNVDRTFQRQNIHNISANLFKKLPF